MKILLINETERLAVSIQELLKQHWYEADICADGPTGLAALKTGQYDAVLLDFTLPGKDGPALLKEIRSCGISIPAVLLTEKNRPSDRITGLEAGADYCLEKPFDTGELLAVIKTVTRRRGELLPDCLSYGNLSLNQTTYCLSGPKPPFSWGGRNMKSCGSCWPTGKSSSPRKCCLQNLGRPPRCRGKQRGNLHFLSPEKAGMPGRQRKNRHHAPLWLSSGIKMNAADLHSACRIPCSFYLTHRARPVPR